jgi:tetratricopeptide (TPR) repeat protein
MGISFGTPDFTDFRKSIDEKSKEKLKKIQGDDPQIKEIIERIESSNDMYEILEECVKWKVFEPESPVPDVMKAESYHRLKQNKKAQELFKNVIKNYDTYGYAYERYGHFLLNTQKFEEAIECCDTALEVDKNNVDVMFVKGDALMSIGKYQEAIECCDTALEVDKNNVGLLAVKVTVLWFLEKFEEALEILDRVLDMGDNDVYLLCTLKGIVLSRLGKHQEAIEFFDKYLEMNSNNKELLVGKSNAFFNLGKFEEALEILDRVLDMGDNDATLLNFKGQSLIGLRKFEEALECFDTALEMELSTLERANILSNGKAYALIHLKKHQEALECCDTALDVDIAKENVFLRDMLYSDILKLKLVTFTYLEKHQEALEISEELLNINENDNMALIMKPISLDNLGKTQEAIKWMEAYGEKFDINLDFHHWNVKAEMLDKVEKYPDSIACYKKALSIEENEKTRKSLNAVIEKQNKLQKEDGSNEANNDEKPQWTNDPTTDAQRQYIKKLGGDDNAPKTKGEASEMITKLKEEN